MRGLGPGNSVQTQDDVKKLNDAAMRDIVNTLNLLLEHQMVLSTTRVVLRPFDGEKRCLEKFLVCVFLAHVQLRKVVLEKVFTDPLVARFKVLSGEARVEHERLVLKEENRSHG